MGWIACIALCRCREVRIRSDDESGSLLTVNNRRPGCDGGD